MKYNATMIPQEVEKGTILQAETIEALAAVAGVDVTGVTATVERYNSSVAEGRDESYFKPAAHLRAVATPPYYVVELRTAGVAVTGAGLRIDADSRVLTPAGLPIPGLFATGETTVGVYGERYVGGGNSIGQAVIFGRVAGRKTASERESAASNTISG
jgi:fumarate reductase flavoprotein subunit